jgi:hypothetical protein
MKKALIIALFAFFILHSSFCISGNIFVGSDTYVVTNAATSVILATNAPTSGGFAMPWNPAGILANFRDSPTGAVLVVQHIRSGVRNPRVSTNTISITNAIYTSGTGSVSAIVWDPDGVYTINPQTDSLRISTSSTNAEIIINKEVSR